MHLVQPLSRCRSISPDELVESGAYAPRRTKSADELAGVRRQIADPEDLNSVLSLDET